MDATAAASTRSPAGTSARFAALDGWRGVCALMVVLLHAPVDTAFTRSALVAHSFLFVDFFFVLSGFVIAHAAAGRLAAGRDWRGFVAGRLRRVYPLHLFMLALFLLFEFLTLAAKGPDGAFQGGNGVAALVHNLLLTHALGTVPGLGWNYPSWSISAEFLAYLLFAAAVLAAGRRLFLVLGLAAALSALVVAAGVGHMETMTAFGWARCLFGFAVGALLRLALWPAMAPAGAGHRGWWTLAEAGAVLLVASFVGIAGRTALSLAAPLVFAYAILVFAHEGGALSRLMRSAPFAFLGLVSYSIYMTHAFVISRLVNVAGVAERRLGLALMTERPDGTAVLAVGEPAGWLALLLVVGGTLAASALTWRFVERPGQRIGLASPRRGEEDPAQAAPAAPAAP